MLLINGGQKRSLFRSKLPNLRLKKGRGEDDSYWNTVLQTHGWNFLLNDGNWIGHTSLLHAWPTDVKEEKIRATDSIRIVRGFVEKGFTYFVVPELRYLHTVHDDSEWTKTERESSYLLATTQWNF